MLMSIYNLPPPIQTPERNQSRFDRNTYKARLAGASIKRAVQPDVRPAPISYFPTHETLRYRISEIHTVVEPRIAEELQEVVNKIKLVDKELVRQRQRQQIMLEAREDLGLFQQGVLSPHDTNGSGRLVLALQEARAELDIEYEEVRMKRVESGIELEKLEQMDFELLHKGQ